MAAGGGIEAGVVNILIGPKLVNDFATKLSGDLERESGDAGEKAGLSLGKRMSEGLSKTGAALTKSVTAPILAGFTGIIAGSLKVDEAFDTIRVKTGATGSALKGFEDNMKGVAGRVAAPLNEIAGTLSDLTVRLGLTGKPLENLTTQVTQLGKMTGEALNTETFAKSLQAFGIESEDASKYLDQLFRASQITGVGVNQLTANMQANAATLEELGFSYSASIALLGSFEKSGLDGTKMLNALKRAYLQSIGAADEAAKRESKLRGVQDDILKKREDLAVAQQRLTELQNKGGVSATAYAKAQEKVAKAAEDLGVRQQKLAVATAQLNELRNKKDVAPSSIMAKELEIARYEQEIAELNSKVSAGPQVTEPDGASQSQLLAAQNSVAQIQREIAALESEGAGLEDTLSMLAANAGKSMGEFVLEAIDRIKVLIDQGNLTAANAIAKNLVGKAAPEFVKAVKSGAFDIQELTKEIELGAETVGKAYAATADFPEQMEMFKNRLFFAIKPIGDELFPKIEGVLNAILPLVIATVESFTKLPAPLQSTIIGFLGVAALVGPTLTSLATMTSGVIALGGAMTGTSVSAQVLRGALIGIGVGALITLVVLLIQNWDKVKPAVEKAFNAVKSAVSGAIGFIKTNWQSFVALLTGPLGAAVVGIIKNWDRIKAGFAAAMNGLKNLASGVGKTLLGAFNSIGGSILKVWNGLRNAAARTVEFIAKAFSMLPRLIANAAGAIAKIPGLSNIFNVIGATAKVISSVPGFADGGRFPANRPMMVGEEGPELLLPNRSGLIIPNDILTGGLGGTGATYNVVINNPIAETSSSSIPAALRRANILRSNA